ncbi:histidinol-phosphate transaminase [Planctellipticum variicoloris]|uniref:histidinol-phosphate transaminase n=1 Tax=Planctellipticum variicoloris TaxID=3064265 RepID=UPI00301391D6|nr:histidinol-phosphate transaminase [Planctomycetaceae bacterium SH412]
MSLFRPDIDRIAGYVPGEQPQEAGWIKLNTNENPYPPSPRVVAAITAAAHGRLNLYPDPLAKAFRRAAGEVFGVDPDWILPANGSDENLTIITRSFADGPDLIAYPYPSYILYETLADLQGARHERILLQPDWSWDPTTTRGVVERSKLIFVPNPNSPSGNRWTDAEIEALVPPAGVLVLDEAYGDFADNPHRAEILRGSAGRQIIVTRTFSKSYSLAGIRFGFAIAHPDLIAGMRKVKDSYNCDSIALAAATAAIEDQAWMEANVERIRATRTRMFAGLQSLGFAPVPSQTNFVWCSHPTGRHKEIYEGLKARKILVRYMAFPDVAWAADGRLDGLRITVGTDAEIDALLTALGEITRTMKSA